MGQGVGSKEERSLFRFTWQGKLFGTPLVTAGLADCTGQTFKVVFCGREV